METPGVLTDIGMSANTGKMKNVPEETYVNFFTTKDQMETEATREAENTVTIAEEATAVAVVRRAAARWTAVKEKISKFNDNEFGCNATVLHSCN